jgi:ketosteroid isomerase-like protein
MRLVALICAAASALYGAPAPAEATEATEKEVLALERAAMDGWHTGTPAPALAAFDPSVTFFHIMTGGRLDGVSAVKGLYDGYRGISLFDSYEIVKPKVQVAGEVAILTYILTTQKGSTATRWNATQVYRRTKDGWRVIHGHWSQTMPPANSAER